MIEFFQRHKILIVGSISGLTLILGIQWYKTGSFVGPNFYQTWGLSETTDSLRVLHETEELVECEGVVDGTCSALNVLVWTAPNRGISRSEFLHSGIIVTMQADFETFGDQVCSKTADISFFWDRELFARSIDSDIGLFKRYFRSLGDQICTKYASTGKRSFETFLQAGNNLSQMDTVADSFGTNSFGTVDQFELREITSDAFERKPAQAPTNTEADSFQPSYNENGAILSTSDTTFFLGKDCDAFSKKLGQGHWSQNEMNVEILLGERKIALENQIIEIDGSDCIGPVELLVSLQTPANISE